MNKGKEGRFVRGGERACYLQGTEKQEGKTLRLWHSYGEDVCTCQAVSQKAALQPVGVYKAALQIACRWIDAPRETLIRLDRLLYGAMDQDKKTPDVVEAGGATTYTTNPPEG